MKLTVFKSRRGRPSQYLQQLNSTRQPLADMVQNTLNIQENSSTDKVVKQKGTTETATTEEMKENCNILQHPALLSTATTKSPDKFFSNMDSNISLHPYIGNSMSTPPTSALNSGLNKQDQNVENLRTPIKEETSVTASPSFYEKENLSSTGSSSSSSSETEISRSPMSICDSSIETSPESTDCTTISPLSGPTDNSTPLHPPQQPARRRPGRPPGSTKKRMQTYAEYRKKGDSNTSSADDFSLRKFFEAGGRDYNEYLDWLKKRQVQQNTTAVIMNQVPSYPNKSKSVIPLTTGVHNVHTTVMPQMAQFSARTTVLNSPKNSMALPPPPYRPMLVPRPTVLPSGVRSDMVPVPSAPPSIQNFPVIHTPTATSPPNRQQKHAPLPQAIHLPHIQDSNALDLSAPTRKRKSEGGSSSEDELPSPTSNSAKLFRDITGSPVTVATTVVDPMFKSPHDTDSSHTNTVLTTPLYKPDINGNVTVPVSIGGASDIGEIVESSTEPDISTWDVDSVVRFINSIPGCQEYSEVFREHKIDGATLPHLSEEHLLNLVKMKLGPAIRLRLAIARMKPSTAL